MNMNDIRQLDEARPFRSFIFHLADGRNVKVEHPEFLAYTPGGETIIVLQTGGGFKILDHELITEIEVTPLRSTKR